MKELKSIVTDDLEHCAICGSPNVEIHHMEYGVANRILSDQDGLIIPLCAKHHKDSRYVSVHGNPVIANWSRMLAQLAWERNAIANGSTMEEARENYRRRFGKSHL